MIRVRYVTTTFRPPQRVSCRIVAAERPWPEFAGFYVDGLWLFDLPDDIGDQAVLALDGQVEGERKIRLGPLVELDDAAVGLRPPPIAVDDGRLQRTWFAEGTDAAKRWDVIVVGTGMGGGTLLTSLARNPMTENGRRLDVLGLEAGSLLFTGHAGNQPAVRPTGDAQFPITMWNTLPDFGTVPFERPEWSGRELFALGGRSLYWGALAPRIDPAELKEHWPQDLRLALDEGSSYYADAEQLLEVGRPRADDIARDGLRVLDDLLPRRANGIAPVALRREKPTSWRIPGGLFSTAELLLEERLSRNSGGYGPPYIHLGELVIGVEPDDAGWVVHTVDLRDGGPKVRYARKVVLCCGTVESARILAASPKALPREVAERRTLTEHLMGWVHFEIPPGTPFCRADTSAKLLSTPGSSGADWNLILDLGSDLNLGFADAEDWARSATSPGAVAGQLVILGRASPEQTGVPLRFGPDPWLDLNLPGGGLPKAILDAPKQGEIPEPWHDAARSVITALGAQALAGERADPNNKGWPRLRIGGWGYVAHEVGTLPVSDNGTGVVDTNLAVTGVGGLFVCDNSVFPTSPAANPSLTLAALALRLADHLRGLEW